jgi:hypothetical protein
MRQQVGSEDDAFDFSKRLVSKVDEKSEFEASSFEIILNLRAMRVRQLFDGFEFNDDFVVTNEVRDIFAVQLCSFVFDLQTGLRDSRNIGQPKLDFQAFLINWLKKPCAFVPINFKQTTTNGETLLRK